MVEKTKRDIKYDLLAYNYFKELDDKALTVDGLDIPTKQIIIRAVRYRKQYISNAESILKKIKELCKDDSFDMFKEYFVDSNSIEEQMKKYGIKKSAFLMKVKRLKEAYMGDKRVHRYETYSFLTPSEKKEILDSLCKAYKPMWELVMEQEKDISSYFQAMIAIKKSENNYHYQESERAFLNAMDKKEKVEKERELVIKLINYTDALIKSISNTNFSVIQYQLMWSMLDKKYKNEFKEKLDISGNYRVWVVKAAEQIFSKKTVIDLYNLINSLNEDSIEQLELEDTKALLAKNVTPHLER